MPFTRNSNQIELSRVFTGPRSDASHDAAERGQATASTERTSADTLAPPTSRMRNLFSAINLKKAGIATLALGGGAGALAGLYKLGESHGRSKSLALPRNAGNAHAPVAMPPPAISPSVIAAASCDRVDAPVDADITKLLATSSAGATPGVKGSLYSDGMPHADDISLLATHIEDRMVAHYGIAGVWRATVLLELATVDPGFIKSMVVDNGGGNYMAKLHTYDGATDTFKQVAVPVSIGEIPSEFLTAANPGPWWEQAKVDVPAWWLAVVHAGAKLDAVARPELGITATAADRTDGKAYQRNAVRSILGTGTEIVSTDELDMMRDMETIPDSAYDIISNQTAMELDPSVRTFMGNLMESKTDNWAGLLGRMRDRRNVALLNFHQILDFQIESWVRGNNTTPYFSFTTDVSHTTISGGDTFGGSNGTFISQTIQMNLANSTTYLPKILPCGPNAVYAVVGAEQKGVWLRISIGDNYGSPTETKPHFPFFVPNDALAEMTASVSLARRPCATDSDFLLPRPQSA